MFLDEKTNQFSYVEVERLPKAARKPRKRRVVNPLEQQLDFFALLQGGGKNKELYKQKRGCLACKSEGVGILCSVCLKEWARLERKKEYDCNFYKKNSERKKSAAKKYKEANLEKIRERDRKRKKLRYQIDEVFRRGVKLRAMLWLPQELR